MASPETPKTSLERWSAKPLHGRASAVDYVRMSDRWPAIDAVGRSELAEGPGLDRLPRQGSDEGESQKAGTEQGDPTGSQGKEAVGNEISISHDTPSDSDAVPN